MCLVFAWILIWFPWPLSVLFFVFRLDYNYLVWFRFVTLAETTAPEMNGNDKKHWAGRDSNL